MPIATLVVPVKASIHLNSPIFHRGITAIQPTRRMRIASMGWWTVFRHPCFVRYRKANPIAVFQPDFTIVA